VVLICMLRRAERYGVLCTTFLHLFMYSGGFPFCFILFRYWGKAEKSKTTSLRKKDRVAFTRWCASRLGRSFFMSSLYYSHSLVLVPLVQRRSIITREIKQKATCCNDLRLKIFFFYSFFGMD
jgi:hypothetical protein